MKLLKIYKSKLNKRGFEIIRNIELICFLPYKYIKTYIKFLKNNLIQDSETELFEYLNNNWFNHEYEYYNYSELFYTQSLKDIRIHFYSTNNIAEALHNKLALYIPNKKVSNTNFIMSICNVIKNYEIKCNDIVIRKDYTTQTLIELSKKRNIIIING